MKAGKQVCAQQKHFSPFQELASSSSFTPTQGMGKKERKPSLSGLEALLLGFVEHVTQRLPVPSTSKHLVVVKDSIPTNKSYINMSLWNSKLKYLPEKVQTKHKTHLT